MPTNQPRLVTAPVFVLRPGDPLGQHDNVYLDSTSLWNAASLVSGSKRIEIDGSLAVVNWLADGLQDVSGVEFFSSQEALQGYTLNLNDGVQWTFTSLYVNGVFIESNSTSLPVFTLNNPGEFAFLFIYLEGSVWSNTAVATFLVEAGEFSAEVSDLGNIGDGTHPTIKAVTPGSFDGIFVDGSELEVGAFDPTSTGTFSISYDAGSPPGSQAPLTPTMELIDTAPNVGYTPAVPADWSPPPTETAAAIDQLAARLTGSFADLFGNGATPDPVINAPTPNFVGGDYDNFTLGLLGVLTPPLGQGIVIRAQGTITINGTIDASGVIEPITMPGLPAALSIGDQEQAGSGGAGGGGGGPNGNGQQSFTNGNGGSGGPNIGYIVGFPSSSGNSGQGGDGGPTPTVGQNGSNATGPAVPGGPSPWLLQVLRLQTWRIIVGGVGGAPGSTGVEGGQGGPGNGVGNPGTGGNGGQGGTGGNGGGTILLIAPNIVLNPAAQLISNGTNGTDGTQGAVGSNADAGSNAGGGGAGGGGGGGQGGCGGLIYLLTKSLSDPGPCTKNVIPGTGGNFGASNTGGTGDVTGPAPNGQNGGSSGNGSPGCSGSVGIVFEYTL